MQSLVTGALASYESWTLWGTRPAARSRAAVCHAAIRRQPAERLVRHSRDHRHGQRPVAWSLASRSVSICASREGATPGPTGRCSTRGDRRRPGRIGPDAGVVVRHRRPQGNPWPGALHRGLPDQGDDRPPRPDGQHGARHRRAAHCDRGAGRSGSAPGGGTGRRRLHRGIGRGGKRQESGDPSRGLRDRRSQRA